MKRFWWPVGFWILSPKTWIIFSWCKDKYEHLSLGFLNPPFSELVWRGVGTVSHPILLDCSLCSHYLHNPSQGSDLSLSLPSLGSILLCCHGMEINILQFLGFSLYVLDSMLFELYLITCQRSLFECMHFRAYAAFNVSRLCGFNLGFGVTGFLYILILKRYFFVVRIFTLREHWEWIVFVRNSNMHDNSKLWW